MRMSDKIFSALAYVQHRACAANTLGYGIHSPYLFNIARTILTSHEPYYAFLPIEQLRREYLSSDQTVYVEDYGTGQSGTRRVCDIAAQSLMPREEAQLLMRLAVMMDAKEMVELGTCLGISSAYMASVGTKAHLTTFEGAPEVAALAKKGWETLGLRNIDCIVGNIDDTLPTFSPARPIDMAFIDANHTGEALLSYFDKIAHHLTSSSIVVLDDIHCSRSMEAAWREICRRPDVTATMDLYSMALVFFDKNFEKRTYRIRL